MIKSNKDIYFIEMCFSKYALFVLCGKKKNELQFQAHNVCLRTARANQKREAQPPDAKNQY